MLVRGYDDNGKLFFKQDNDFKPKIYLPSSNKNSKYKSLKNVPLEPFQAGTIKDVKEFIEKYKKVDNFDYFGMENWIINYAVENFSGKIQYDFNLINYAFFDIETTCEEGFPNVETANEEILIVSFWNRGKYFIFSTEKYGKFESTREDVISETFASEEEMLEAVIRFFDRSCFDVISGWNSDFFDIPYLINRIEKVLGERQSYRLSPWRAIKEITIPSLKGDMKSYSIVGVNHIDYLAAFKKFSGVQVENYKLDTIGNFELNLKKLDYSEYESMRELYRQNFQKFGEYNLRDNEILVGVEKKRKILELIASLALNAKVNMIDTFKQTVMWDAIFYDHLLQRNIIVPKKEKHELSRSIPGGHVKETRPGKYNWIVSLDLDSLYPHLIMQYNISPETYVEQIHVNIDDLVNKVDAPILDKLKSDNCGLAGNGAIFKNDIRGFIPELMDVMYRERKAFKEEMLVKKTFLESNKEKLSENEKIQLGNDIARLNMFQNVRKIQLNSAYGSLAQVGFRFFMYELASAITLSGQVVLRWVERKLNEFMNKLLKTNNIDYVLAADTDSIHLDFEGVVEKFKKTKPEASRNEIVDFIDKLVERRIQPYLDELYLELAEYMNVYEQKMHMKRENIVEVGVYLAKKKYIYNVMDSEGVRYSEPNLKVTGLELVKSNTPSFCRKKMKEACKIILEKKQEDLIQFVEQTKIEFDKLPFEDIAYPQSVNHIEKYTDDAGHYIKGTQIYARGAIIYNKIIKEKNLIKKYEKIGDGDKIKYCYLKVPNPLGENIISVPFSLPKEFGITEYVDYDTQFDKTFIKPVERITDAVGWSLKKENSLEDFFSS